MNWCKKHMKLNQALQFKIKTAILFSLGTAGKRVAVFILN